MTLQNRRHQWPLNTANRLAKIKKMGHTNTVDA